MVAVGHQYAFAEDLFFQVGAGRLVEVEGQPVLGGGGAGELPRDDAAHPGVLDDLGDLGFDLVAGPVGVAPSQGVGQRGELRDRLGQGLVEAAGLGGVQGGGMGEHYATVGAEDLAAVLQGGQPGEPVGVHQVPVGGGSGQQVRAVRGWD